MTDLDKILLNINPEILDEGFIPDTNLSDFLVNSEDKIIYQEPVSQTVAQALVPSSEYDPQCRYQILTLNDVTLIIKIDDRINPKDRNNNLGRKYITEYVLDSSEDVISYDAMSKSILNPEVINISTYTKENKVKNFGIWLPVITLLTLFSIGAGLLYYILNIAYR